MSEFERGAWATMAVVVTVLSLALYITGSDDWMDGLTTAGLMVYIVVLGKRTAGRR